MGVSSRLELIRDFIINYPANHLPDFPILPQLKDLSHTLGSDRGVCDGIEKSG